MKKRFLLFLFLFIGASFQLLAQRTVTGSVITEDGEALIGVNVVEVGTTNGTITDLDGKYSLTVGDNATLEFSIVGYQAQQIEVGAQSVVDCTLAEGVQLGEVVITALGIEREKKALAYSVTEVSGESFTEAREVNIANALSGKVAGVNVSNVASGAGGSSRVIIRGNSSLTGNNQPLYVVDGIPIDNQNLGSAGMWGGSDWGDGVSSVNPDDIETMTVLKGNTAAALYGSRASNGVILITTKSGTKRKGIGVELSSNLTAENIINTYDFQEEYGSGNQGVRPTSVTEALDFGLSSWGERLDGASTAQFDGVSRPYSARGNNLDEYYRTGYTWTNSLALTGGNDMFNFRMGVTNLENQGITPNSGLDRNTFTSKINGKFGKLSGTISGSYVSEGVQNRPRLSDSPGNANATIYNLPPNVSVEDMQGPNGNGSNESNVEFPISSNTFVQNPYWAAYRFENISQKNRLLGNFTLRYDFTDWLYLQGRVGVDQYTSRRRSLEGYGTAYKPLGGLTEEERRFTEINKDFLLGINKSFGEIGLNAFVGGNQMENSFEILGGGGNDFAIPFLETLNNLNSRGTNYDISEKAINSLYGSLEVSYGNFVYLTFTGRNDWFSTLSNVVKDDEDNSIFYPSVGAAFVLTDALDIPSDILSFAKVRASWAQVGGDTDPYKVALTYGLFEQGHVGQPLGRISQSEIPNANLVPLTNTEIEIGVDLRFFQNRLGLDLAYYDRKTEDDILVAAISQTSGFPFQIVNVGELSNKGVEVLLTGTPVRNRNLSWDVSLNFAYNDSEIVSLLDDSNNDLAGTDDAERIQIAEARSQNAYIQHVEGFPYGSIMGFRYARNEDGTIALDDTGLPLQGDFGILGEGIHPLTLGMNNTISWKNFSLSFLLDMKMGGDIYSGTNANSYSNGLHKNTLEGRETGVITLPDGGTTTLDPNLVQSYWGRLYSITEEFVYDASFLKLRQMQLSYSFPKTFVEKTPFAGASLSLVGRNLWLIWSQVDNIDPEATYDNGNGQGLEWFGVPQTRSIGLDLNIRF